jgi:ribose-phosphate pyrophosphokinase
MDLSNTVVVSPDLGYAKSASAFARRLGLNVAFGAKQRFADDVVKISAVIGDVAGRDIIIVDDEIAGGSTVLELLERLREIGVGRVRVACTHGLFGRHALERLAAQADIDEIVTMNTVPIPYDSMGGKLTVLSVAPALAEAMRRIHDGESVSELFHAG